MTAATRFSAGRAALRMSLLGGAVVIGLAISCAQLSWAATAAVQADVKALGPRISSALMLSAAVAGRQLVAVGERGLVLISDDDGATWSRASSPTNSTLTSVEFSDDRNGWATGHDAQILHTSDGGRTWQKQLDARQAASKILAEAGQVKDGTPAQRSTIADAQQLGEGSADRPLFSVSVDAAGHGFAVGAFGLAFETTDAGGTWRSIEARIPNPKGKHLYAVMRTERAIWLIGEQGGMYRSLDAGASFAEVPVPYAGTLFGGVAISDQVLLAYGLRGTLLRTEDGGGHWEKVALPQAGASITSAALLKDGRLLLGDQAGQVLISSDQGKSFHSLDAKSSFPIDGLVQSVSGNLILATVRGMSRVSLDVASTSQ